MISPIAQCRADASGNFRKAVVRGDRTAASCLSNLQNMRGLIKRKASNNNYELGPNPDHLRDPSNILSLFAFSVHTEVLYAKFYRNEHTAACVLNRFSLHLIVSNYKVKPSEIKLFQIESS